jgi:hypothetical protein
MFPYVDLGFRLVKGLEPQLKEEIVSKEEIKSKVKEQYDKNKSEFIGIRNNLLKAYKEEIQSDRIVDLYLTKYLDYFNRVSDSMKKVDLKTNRVNLPYHIDYWHPSGDVYTITKLGAIYTQYLYKLGYTINKIVFEYISVTEDNINRDGNAIFNVIKNSNIASSSMVLIKPFCVVTEETEKLSNLIHQIVKNGDFDSKKLYEFLVSRYGELDILYGSFLLSLIDFLNEYMADKAGKLGEQAEPELRLYIAYMISLYYAQKNISPEYMDDSVEVEAFKQNIQVGDYYNYNYEFINRNSPISDLQVVGFISSGSMGECLKKLDSIMYEIINNVDIHDYVDGVGIGDDILPTLYDKIYGIVDNS